ncbi:enzymatic polyprotein [Tanacetum coccineum]
MKQEEDIEKILQNSSYEKPKWYVIFNGPFRGIYTDWATASTHIIGKSVSHKSYLTKEAAEKALEESYKTIATEECTIYENISEVHLSIQIESNRHSECNTSKRSPCILKNVPRNGNKPTIVVKMMEYQLDIKWDNCERVRVMSNAAFLELECGETLGG